MLSSLRNIFRVPDLRNKILFTLLMIALYRLGAYIPVPGHRPRRRQAAARARPRTGGVLGFLKLFSGGALTQFAVFALGIMPYITASIIMQILAVVIPKLEQWQEQGAVGQRKITQWTRYLTIAIALLQATGLAFLFHNGGGGALRRRQRPPTSTCCPTSPLPRVLLVVLTLTAGTALLMWMGELITQRGIGNGMSLLIFASVVSTLPFQCDAILEGGEVHRLRHPGAARRSCILVAIVFVEQGQRRIPVQFAKRVVGRRMYGGQSTYIPLKVNQAGVIPIIFASSVLYLPCCSSNVLPADGLGRSRAGLRQRLPRAARLDRLHRSSTACSSSASPTSTRPSPSTRSSRPTTIRKQGGFIPGIRPGPQTERYLPRS